MQPVLLDRFRQTLLKHGPLAAQAPETRVNAHGRDEVFYIPFEYVNTTARLVIIGITPGPNQIKAAYGTAQRLLRAGTPDRVVLAEAKREGAFGSSTMRPNLVRMLDELGFPELLGLTSCGELWESAFGLLHATSVVPNASFRNGKPFAGSFDDVLKSKPFRREFEEHFVPSLASLPSNALYVALGPTPLAALDWCAERGHLDACRIMGALAHPSTNGGSQVDVYLGKKGPEDLKPKDPVVARVPDLRARARRMREAVLRAGGGRSVGLQFATPSPPPRAAVTEVAVPARPMTQPFNSAPAAIPTDHVDPTLRAVFERAGYRCISDTVKKVALFAGSCSGREVYLVNGRPVITVVVHPGSLAAAEAAAREPLVQLPNKLFHHDNMRTFPSRHNGGTKPVRYGRSVTCQTLGALEEFLAAFDTA